MSFVVKDRVRETTTTTGTGTLTLAGAVTGYQAFSVIGNGNTTEYWILHRTAAEWEHGIRTYTSSGTTLARTRIIESSNSGSAVSLSSGTKDVIVGPSGTYLWRQLTSDYPITGSFAPVDVSKYFYSELGFYGENLAATPTFAPVYAIAGQGTYADNATLTDQAFYVINKTTGENVVAIQSNEIDFLPAAGPTTNYVAITAEIPVATWDRCLTTISLIAPVNQSGNGSDNYFSDTHRYLAYNNNASTAYAPAYEVGVEGNYEDNSTFSEARFYLFSHKDALTVWFYQTSTPTVFTFDPTIRVEAGGFDASGSVTSPYLFGGFGATSSVTIQSTYNASATSDAIYFNVGPSGGPLTVCTMADNTGAPTVRFPYGVAAVPRVTAITSSATPAYNVDLSDLVSITAIGTAITSMTSSQTGTSHSGQKLIFRIKDDGTPRGITWGSLFEACGVALPTTTVTSKRMTVGFIYDSVTSKWGCVAVSQET